jgi:TPR repeat protein
MHGMKPLLPILFLAAAPLIAAEADDLLAKATAGDAAAQLALGQAHVSGKGATKDPKAAIEWLTKAADQRNLEAQLALGKLYLGGSGVPKNGIESAKWYRLAADQGSTTAQIQLARMHLAGTGVSKDEVEACKWAKIAFVKGDKQAKGLLEHLYQKLDGQQVAKAEALAREILDRKPAGTEGVPLVAPPLEPEKPEKP